MSSLEEEDAKVIRLRNNPSALIGRGRRRYAQTIITQAWRNFYFSHLKYYSDEEEEDEEDGEMTEADRKFIVEDDEDEIVSRKRLKKRKERLGEFFFKTSNEPSEEDESEKDLEEDDLDLINENIGASSKKVFKRLRKKLDHDSSPKDLNQLFEEDDQPQDNEVFDSRELYAQDDLDDFIIDDDEGENLAGRKERLRQRRERMENAGNRGADYGVSDEYVHPLTRSRAWAEINELFGDGSDYAFAMFQVKYSPSINKIGE